jgi:hypothetical protein
MDEGLSLGQFICMVRRELQWAHDIDRDHPLRFDVESVALDLVVEADRTSKAGGSLDLKVLGVGLSGNADGESSQHRGSTVHVVLTARDAGGGKLQVAADDFDSPRQASR